MAEAIAIFLLTEAVGAAAVGGTLLSVTTTVIGIGLSVGASALAAAFLQGNTRQEPTASDHQFITRSNVAPRTRSYGRVRVSGAQVFIEAIDGALFRVLAHADGVVDGVEEHLLGEEVVLVGGDGWVLGPSIYGGYVRILAHDGSDAGLHYTQLAAALPDWTADHLGKGVAHSVTRFSAVPQEHFRKVYPQAHNTAYKQTLRGALVWDPRDPAQDPDDPGTWVWSENLGLQILDFLRHKSGFGMPLAWLEPEIEAWKAEADVCDEPVAKRRGGFEARYRGAGTYTYNERPGDVLDRMLAACNGKLLRGPGGGIRLLTGRWIEPTVRLDDAAIVAWDIGAGNEGPSAANTLRSTYLEPMHGFIETDAEPWVDAGAVSIYGEIAAQAPLSWCPSHGQARRLMKQAAVRLAPEWRGTITTNLRGLAAMDQRFVTISIGELGLSFPAEIDDADFVSQDGIVIGARLAFVATPPETFDWDAVAEEGQPPETAPDTAGGGLVAPTLTGIEVLPHAGGPIVKFYVTAAVESWLVEVDQKLAANMDWMAGPLSDRGVYTLETATLTADVSWQFRLRFSSGYGLVSSWSAVQTLTTTVDTTPPGVPTGLSVTLLGDGMNVAWTQPSSANARRARVYWSLTNNPATATLMDTVWAGPLALSSAKLPLPTVGVTNYYWVAAVNGSAVEGVRTSAGNITP